MELHFLHNNFTLAAVEQSIPSRFEEQVALYPDLPAIRTRTREFSYAALNRLANRIAHGILARRGTCSEPVALLFDYDALIIAAMLGTLKAGKFYLPLDPSHPRARLTHMLADSEAALILCDAANHALAAVLSGDPERVLLVEVSGEDYATSNPGLVIAPDAPANLVYTSGSTGQPKGVLQNHRNQLHLTMCYTNSIGIVAGDRHSLVISLNFGGAAWATYSALLNGACLCPKDLKHDGMQDMAGWLAAERISHMDATPTLFRHFLALLDGSERFPDLRMINLGGEPLRRSDVELFRKHFRPPCLLRNDMGSTETGEDCHFTIDHTREFQGNLMPIGYDEPGKQTLLLDDEGREVGFNRAGAMVIRSRYLSPGYWRRPDLTAERFSVDPDDPDLRRYRMGDMGIRLPDGCLLHLGRQDFQVKIRGHRIELAEIEAALLMLDGINDAVVLAREDQPSAPRLVGYIVPKATPPSASALRAGLARTLPEYMIPAAFVMLAEIPLTSGAKIDRQALPAPSRERPALANDFAAPATPLEERLCEIWSEVLGVEGVGLHDQFIELGGDSLLAARVTARVIQSFAIEALMVELLKAGTVAEMAMMVLARQIAALPEGLRKSLSADL